MAENNAIYFGIRLDNDQLQRDADRAKNTLGGISSDATKAGVEIDSAFKGIAASIAGAFTIKEATNFISQIIKVRGEIESLEISFETLLGSRKKSEALFGELREFAVNTPLQLNDLAKGAQMLLSFNVPAEKVMDTLKHIGDISMGNADKFNSLTLAFSQMSSTGKLMGQDLLQMINAGFNPLSVISEKTGRSIADLKEDMSKGAISADMIAQAFTDAASEGGKFYGMLEKQSQGINGSISNLRGAIDDMFNELGSSSEGVITDSIQGLTKIVKSYKEIGESVALLVTGYGAYKAALIVTNTVQNAAVVAARANAIANTNLTAVNVLLGQGIKSVQAAQLGLNKAMMVNPYALAATAIVGLLAVMYKLVTQQSAAEKAQEAVNNAMKKASEGVASDIAAITQLSTVINNSNASYATRKKALEDLIAISPEHLKGITLETFKTKEATLAIEDYINSRKKQIYMDSLQAELDESLKRQQEAERGDAVTWYEKAEFGIATGTANAFTMGIKNLFTGGAQKEYENFSAKINAQRIEDEKAVQAKIKEEITKATSDREEITSKSEEKIAQRTYTTLDELKSQIADAKQTVEENRSMAKLGLVDVKEVEEAEKALKDLQSQYNSMTGSKMESRPSTAEADKRKASLAKVEELETQMREKIAAGTVDAMKDGEAKKLAQIDEDYRKEVASINEWKKKVEEAQGGNMTNDQATMYESAARQAEDKMRQSVSDLCEEQTKAEQEAYNTMQKMYGTYQEKRLAVTREYNEKIAKANAEGNVNRADLLQKEKKKALSDVSLKEIQDSGVMTKLMGDLQYYSTATIKTWVASAKKIIDESTDLTATDQKTLVETVKKAQDQINANNPFQALKEAYQKYHAAVKSGDDSEIADAQAEVRKSTEATVVSMTNLSASVRDAISAMTDSDDATSQMMGGILSFAETAATGISKVSGAAAASLSALEKASVILTIISAAIALVQQLDSLFSAKGQYDKYAEKTKSINQMAKAVRDYKSAVLDAEKEEALWFSNDGLTSLQTQWRISSEALDNYNAKLHEQQAVYQDESAGGWFASVTRIANKAYENLTKVAEKQLGDFGKKVSEISGKVTSFGWVGNGSEKYNESTTEAINNLRIETRAKTSGFLGIGGKKQKTEDLKEWIKGELGLDLFDENGMMDTKVAETILEDYGDKLVGETKATLTELKEMQEKYDEYQQQLKEYVSQMYEPLLQDFTDSVWDWYDNGVDAMDSFKKYASDTFRSITNDLIKQVALGQLFDTYKDDIKTAYDDYAKGSKTKDQLITAINQSTNQLIADYNDTLPVVQELVTNMGDQLAQAGINIKQTDTDTSTRQASEKGIATASQDSIDELNGRMTAVQGHTFLISENTKVLVSNMTAVLGHLNAIENNTARLDSIENSMTAMKNTVNDMALKGVKVK